jgi:hypothetical protein
MEQPLELEEKAVAEAEASMADAIAMRKKTPKTPSTYHQQDLDKQRASERREPEQPHSHGATEQ